ncbi:MAG: radical SAM protein [Thermoguttaceae bacterium]
MGTCMICSRSSQEISQALGLCAACILQAEPASRLQAAAAHRRLRKRFGLPEAPPQDPQAVGCQRCANACKIGEGRRGYCGVRQVRAGRLEGGGPDDAAVSWYYDPIPTNCVADWVCPASSAAGYPEFTDTEGPEQGYYNLAVFYEACSFDCLFCQNWHFRRFTLRPERHHAAELARAADQRTRCICFFGGDPACQVEHALAAARLARENRQARILRICWETNGSVARGFLDQMCQVSLESGGCIKFDLKAWDEPLHWALCGTSNRSTLANFEHVAGFLSQRPDPPLLVAATLLVSGYVDATQVGRLAGFIARLSPEIPYALLAFHPAFEMTDLPTTSRQQATACLDAARAAGLTRVRLGNIHLIR